MLILICFWMCNNISIFWNNRKIKAIKNDEYAVYKHQSTNNKNWFTEHWHGCKFIINLKRYNHILNVIIKLKTYSKWLTMIFNEIILFQGYYRTTNNIQISEMKRIRKLRNRIWLYNFNITKNRILKQCILVVQNSLLRCFRKNNLYLSLFNKHIIIKWMNKRNFKSKAWTRWIKEFTWRNIISKNIICTPSTKKRKTWTHINFNTIIISTNHRSWNISNLIPIINITSLSR